MIPMLTRLLHAFLYDEDKGPRWFAMACGAVGTVLVTGGNVPGTQIVVPGLASFQFAGPYFLLAALAITSITTATKDGKGDTPTEPKP